MGKKTFSIKNGDIDKMGYKFAHLIVSNDENLKKNITRATDVVFAVATAKRPYITQDKAKAQGRSRIRGSRKFHVVSDPDAKVGVPVAQINGGTLQISIKKEVTGKSGKWTGIIYTDNPYAKYLEFGTSKMKPRSFMRSAINETRQKIRRYFASKPEFKV